MMSNPSRKHRPIGVAAGLWHGKKLTTLRGSFSGRDIQSGYPQLVYSNFGRGVLSIREDEIASDYER